MLQEKVKNLQESQKNCSDKNDVLLQEIEMLKGMVSKALYQLQIICNVARKGRQ